MEQITLLLMVEMGEEIKHCFIGNGQLCDHSCIALSASPLALSIRNHERGRTITKVISLHYLPSGDNKRAGDNEQEV